MICPRCKSGNVHHSGYLLTEFHADGTITQHGESSVEIVACRSCHPWHWFRADGKPYDAAAQIANARKAAEVAVESFRKAAAPRQLLLDIAVEVDASLPPGSAELRSATGKVRIANLKED